MIRINQNSESGNVFSLVFVVVGLVGLLTVGLGSYIKGPLSSAINVTLNSKLESQLTTAARVMLSDAVVNLANNGDVDSDGFVEAREYTPNVSLGLTGGGSIPASTGLTRPDPYGNELGYCVWDHGPVSNGRDDSGAGTDNRLIGSLLETDVAVAIISAGRDRIFQTGCFAFDGVGQEGLVEVVGSDDRVFSFSYSNAGDVVGGNVGSLWTVSTDFKTASTDLDIEIGTFDDVTGEKDTLAPERNLIVEGEGEFFAIRTDSLAINTTPGAPVAFNDPVRFDVVTGAGRPENVPASTAGDNPFFEITSSSCSDQEVMNVVWDAGLEQPLLSCP